MSNDNAKRPILVTIFAILYCLVGLFALLGGVAALVLGVSVSSTAGAIVGAPTIIIGLIYLVLGYGLLKGWKIMWYLGVLFTILGIIGGILLFPVGLIMTVIYLIVLYYLFRPGVKSFFGV